MRSLNKDCNRPWKKLEASLANFSGGTGNQTKLDVIFKIKRHFSGHLLVVTFPIHPSIKDWHTALIKWTYCIFFFWNLLSQDQSQSENGKPVSELWPSTNQAQLLVRFSVVPSDEEASWKMLNVKPNRNIYWLIVLSGVKLAVHAPPSNLLVLVLRCCSCVVPVWLSSHFLSRAQEAADKVEGGCCTKSRGCCSSNPCQTDSLRAQPASEM